MASNERSGEDLVRRAKEFAVQAHTRIVHLRKYTSAPYAVHLENVAALVAEATDDPETLAAAWLHDVVEDTPTTLEDVEREFGRPVAGIVESLTDVSRPADGNRASRKSKDLQHLARAGAAAKTVKLADLIDNCRDICRHDRKFARVYLAEMQDLLPVLREGDHRLYSRAEEAHGECSRSLAKSASQETDAGPPDDLFDERIPPHLVRLFREAFTVLDISHPVRSFGIEQLSAEVRRIMDDQSLEVACLRDQGMITGYVQRGDLGAGVCGEHLRRFRTGQTVPGDSALSMLVRVLTMHEHAFVTVLDEVAGVAGRSSLNTPVARMWLFGIVTMTEMLMTRLIGEHFPGGAWRTLVSPGRLEKAAALQRERERRGQHSSLLECLQFSEKGQILIERPAILESLGFPSKSTAKGIIKELESLRNNLAHAQDIVTHDWAAIARLASRIEGTSEHEGR
jgi:HD domain